MDERILKQRARERLNGHWGISIGVAAVAALLGGLIVGSSFLPEVDANIPITFLQTLSDKLNQGFQLGNITLSFRTGIFGFAAFLLGGVLELGYAKFLLKQHDGKEYEFNDLFSEFDRFGTGFAQAFLRALYTGLWSLLFIIPGIIAGYKYAMTQFILAENPNLTASEAITLSKEMMDGHKGELFVLDLSMIGWAILAALSLNIGNLWLNPYRNAAYAAFYRELSAQVGRETTVEF